MHQESLRAALRDRTRELHTRLDTALTGPTGRIADVAGYAQAVTVLHALHRHADGPLATWVRTSSLADGLDPSLVPDRTSDYAADLRALGREPEPMDPSPPSPPVPVDDARGLALLYLLAGSAAGARVLLRALPDTVPLTARRGLTAAAGESSTTLWRQTCTLLSHPLDEELQEAVVTATSAVFEMLLDRQELMAS